MRAPLPKPLPYISAAACRRSGWQRWAIEPLAPAANMSNSSLHSSTWSKILQSQADWSDKDEFLDVIYWMRQILGILLGLIWGLVPLTGIVGLVLFFATNAGIIYLYFSGFQKVDEEEYGGAWELTKEGFMTSFAGFLVTWIIIYSGLHFTEQDLQSYLSS